MPLKKIIKKSFENSATRLTFGPFTAQHGINADLDQTASAIKEVQPLLAAAAAYRGRDRNRSKENLDRSRDSSSQDLNKAELRDSLLGQALEAGTTLSVTQVNFIPQQS